MFIVSNFRSFALVSARRSFLFELLHFYGQRSIDRRHFSCDYFNKETWQPRKRSARDYLAWDSEFDSRAAQPIRLWKCLPFHFWDVSKRFTRRASLRAMICSINEPQLRAVATLDIKIRGSIFLSSNPISYCCHCGNCSLGERRWEWIIMWKTPFAYNIKSYYTFRAIAALEFFFFLSRKTKLTVPGWNNRIERARGPNEVEEVKSIQETVAARRKSLFARPT